MTPITFSEKAFDYGTTGCFYCNQIWTRAIRVDLNWGALYECDHCSKEYIMMQEDNFVGWKPTVTVIKGAAK